MEIRKLPGNFSVCKVEDYSLVDQHTEFCFTGKTDEENSLVCPTDKVAGQHDEPGRRMEDVSDSGRAGFFTYRNTGGHFPHTGRKQDWNFCHIDLLHRLHTDKRRKLSEALDALSRAGYKIRE